MGEITIDVWGIKATTSRDAFDDWDVMSALYDLSNGDATQVVRLMRALFPGKEREIVAEIAVKRDRRIETVSEWLRDAMDAVAKASMAESKN